MFVINRRSRFGYPQSLARVASLTCEPAVGKSNGWANQHDWQRRSVLVASHARSGLLTFRFFARAR